MRSGFLEAARALSAKFIDPGAPQRVQLPDHLCKTIRFKLDAGDCDRSLFSAARAELMDSLARDALARFQKEEERAKEVAETAGGGGGGGGSGGGNKAGPTGDDDDDKPKKGFLSRMFG